LPNESIESWRIHLRGRWLFLLLMVPNIILSVLYWRVDAKDPLTISALLVDRILEITTAIVFPISLVIVLISPVQIARIGAIGASLCSTILGVSASVSALRPPRERFTTMLALVCLIIGLATLVWLTHKVMFASRWRFSLIGLVALVPLIQFWHATSFVPARLTTSTGLTVAVVTVQGESKSSRRGSIQFDIKNDSDVTALILASDVHSCFRHSDAEVKYDDDALFADDDCDYDRAISNLSEIDGHTSFPYYDSFSKPMDRPFFQLSVKVWYARNDRLRIGDEIKVDSAQAADCTDHFATYPILDEAKFRGLVQKERYITYFGDPDYSLGYNITAKGEPLCTGRGYDFAEYYGVNTVSRGQEDWLS
jgi:hypothetical protein